MFENAKSPEDIFAQTDKSAPQVATPVTSAAPISPAASDVTASVESSRDRGLTPQTIQTRLAEMSKEREHKGGGVMKIAIIVLAAIVIVGGAFLISWRILTSKTPVTPSAPQDLETNEQELTPVQPTPIVEEPAPETFVPLDSDQDGLTDDLEIELGTSVNLSDSDADGLFDREEVEVYATDPLNPDTDGDTYSDGMEVKGMYDPKGPGKLLQIPSGS